MSPSTKPQPYYCSYCHKPITQHQWDRGVMITYQSWGDEEIDVAKYHKGCWCEMIKLVDAILVERSKYDGVKRETRVSSCKTY